MRVSSHGVDLRLQSTAKLKPSARHSPKSCTDLDVLQQVDDHCGLRFEGATWANGSGRVDPRNRDAGRKNTQMDCLAAKNLVFGR